MPRTTQLPFRWKTALATALLASVLLPAGAQTPEPSPAPPAATTLPSPAPAVEPVAPTPAEPPAPPSPPPYEAKALKQLEALLNQKFSREPADLLRGLERVTVDPATMYPPERVLMYFQSSNWAKLREEFSRMPADFARKVYDKILADLTEKQKPNVKLEDVLNLADAVPGDFTGDELRRLGQLLSLAVPSTETYWLSDRLKKGTERLGGTDAAKRLLAGRVLLAGGFKDLAREYLPAQEETEKIADEGVRNEITSFLATQREGESALRGQVQRIWEENLRTLINPNPKLNDWERQKAGMALSKIIAQVPPTTLAPTMADLVKNNPEGAARLVAALERKVANDRDNDVPTRTESLRTQATVANLLTTLVDPATAPWGQYFDMMADFWSGEAEKSFTQKAAAQPNQPARWISAEDLLSTAPAGAWESALTKPARDRFDVGLSKAILTGAEFEQAADRIVAIGQRNPAAGASLAEDFLGVWARTHNPQIPEPLRKKFDLPEDAHIPVTPMMMEKNIESLAKMMALFRQAGLAPSDPAKVVNAFDLAYSNAETYRTSHIEKVFGPLEKMDEPLFLLIVSKMSANLGERWRKMDVQKAGLTKRDEGETLELVRTGYRTALQLIQTWAAGHPESYRAPTLAGTLLSEWGDFEYFQELVAGDAKLRMTGYQEKNIQAGESFLRGTQIYAAQVPKLAPSDYSVEPYLAWFQSLLGIGANGQLNLSKALNRAALGKIREQMLALGEKPGKAHISMFARIVNARLTDEKEPLHEDLKYRYLASALLITKDDPFTLGAEKKVAYFDELLSEVRLQTRVDGPNTIGREQDFGIIVSIVHTEAMGRVAKFGQYLTNETAQPGGNKQQKKKSSLVKKMREAQGPRDELELNLTEKLSPFFDIRSITFATPDVKPRPTSQPGWEETVLAYLQVHAKDASVDKIPPVALELKFVDLTGPVTIPAESAETIIKIATEGAPPRPASQVEVTETLDTRQLLINGTLPLEIKATATGLVPELEQLIDLEALKKQLTVKNINGHEGLQVKELNTWGDQVAPRSERLWTVALDGDAVRSAEGPTEFHFPPARGAATTVYQSYSEMNLATLPEPKVEIGRALSPGEQAARGGRAIWWSLAALLVLAAGGAWYLLARGRGAGDQAVRARDVIKMPTQLDGFSVVALLRKLRTSPLVHLPEAQQQELQSDLQRVQQTCFGSSGGMSETDLRGLAEKWLRLAT